MGDNKHFLDYIGSQEQNLLTSLVELPDAFRLFKVLDEIYRSAIDNVDVPESESVVATLFVFTHSQFYSTISSLLRANISDSLSCARRAIDATLSAYKIMEEPSHADAYKTNGFRNIKRDIKKARRADASRYPLAELLIPFHEHCSNIASHADYAGIEPRLNSRELGPGKRLQLYEYFDHPTDIRAYRRLFIDVLAVFHQILAVFRPFLAMKYIGDAVPWNRAVGEIGARLKQLIDDDNTFNDVQKIDR